MSDRSRLALVVWSVLVSQVFLYPGLDEIVSVLGGSESILAGTWFLIAEFAAFVVCAVLWGIVSDSLGTRSPLIVLGAVGGAASYLVVASAPTLGFGFGVVLLVRVIGGAFTIGAFSLSITMLMDLSGGHGRNMGAAGTAIGLGAALGSVVGGQLTSVDPLAPLYGGAALLAGAAVLAATVPDRGSGGGLPVGTVVDRVRTRPTLLVPFAFGYIDRLTAGFFALTGVAYFREAFGVDAAQAGLTLALFFVPFAVLQYPVGSLSDRIGRFVPVVVGSVLYGVTIIAVVLAPTYGIAAGLMVLVGICGALVSPTTMALVTDIVPATERGAAMGGFNVFGSLGMLSGFIIGGTVTELYGYLPAFVAAGGLEIAIATVTSRAVWKITSHERGPVPGGGGG
ncbi:Major Facilitator Superfamily protein [Halopenitus malekzadehii]|jgi:DHA1 family tetracycline resistance protein-like MFS transporter|uniref:Major Facilitator Superfamily protein n=1 Tax=Halopenitus malekzadehii TaxID=1267564 RepID=A0A1H6JA23_9EURY|nr:MFS transporter [Halopenitus malekzadehii]SEH55813.1 Major Facilitator Superfamily protein [Halopenitus malekzadehii]